MKKYPDIQTPDIVYPDHFHRETMPNWLCTTANSAGKIAPDINKPYNYLDIGCGSGLNLLIAASTNPLGNFFGIDANQESINRAQELALSLGISNIKFECIDFKTYASNHSNDKFDFIICHGVYSWICEDQRASIKDIIKMCLSQNGLLYLSYMTHPGTPPLSPLIKLIKLNLENINKISTQSVKDGIEWIKDLSNEGLGFFEQNNFLKKEIEHLSTKNPNYLIHELFSSNWDPLHFSDILSQMESIECNYACSATSIENIDSISLPEKSLKSLSELHKKGASIALIETYKDIARNQSQRRDIYIKSEKNKINLPSNDFRKTILSQYISLTPSTPRYFKTKSSHIILQTRIGPIKFPLKIVEPMLDFLFDSPKTYADIASLPEYKQNPGEINTLIQVLSWIGWVSIQPYKAEKQFTAPLSINNYLRTTKVGEPPIYIQASSFHGTAFIFSYQEVQPQN